MSKAWGGAGAWALDAERAETEEREQSAAAVIAGEPDQSFPSLKEAAASKSKKKKSVPVPLAQFNTSYSGSAASAPDPRGLTPDEMLRLPTGPRERSLEELEQGRLGGGFRSNGSMGGGSGGGRRPYGGFDDETRRAPPSRTSDFDQPSKADEVDNWAASKKPLSSLAGDSSRNDRYGSLGSGGPSHADEIDNWATGKKPISSRYSGYGSSFGDSRAPSDSDRWARGGGGGGFQSNINGERPKLVLDPPKGNVGATSEVVRTRPSPFGAARRREEVLAEKGLDWKKLDSETEMRMTSRPASSHSSRPSSAQSSRPGSPGSQATAEGMPKPRPKVNPFGDAKPREILLAEKGKDWKKIDVELEHRGVDRPETDEEKLLKEEINGLKALACETQGNMNGNPGHLSLEELNTLHEQIQNKERDLELLMRQLDGQVRFRQRSINNSRADSGAGWPESSFARVPPQSDISEELRSVEISDRPRSRGGTGFWGGRNGAVSENRNMNRSRSKERW